MHIRTKCIFVIYSFCLLFYVPAAYAEIGKVLEIKPGATLTTDGRSLNLRVGMPVDTGDVIRTNGTGIVQLIFTDQTKVAVGPNASMVLDVSMMRGGNRAKNFTIKALGGGFRFISGNSKKSAYKITTPTATMGIRGTTFDFWVLDQRQTSLALLKGSVRMCGRGGCRNVKDRCELVATSPRGKVAAPRDNEEAERMLVNGFPFILSQSSLRESLRANVGTCDQYLTPPSREANTAIPTREIERTPSTPEPPAPDPPEPPSNPEPSSGGFPGNSGNSGPSQGRGNSVSTGQNGTGVGNGQGAGNRGGNNGIGNGVGRGN